MRKTKCTINFVYLLIQKNNAQIMKELEKANLKLSKVKILRRRESLFLQGTFPPKKGNGKNFLNNSETLIKSLFQQLFYSLHPKLLLVSTPVTGLIPVAFSHIKLT